MPQRPSFNPINVVRTVFSTTTGVAIPWTDSRWDTDNVTILHHCQTHRSTSSSCSSNPSMFDRVFDCRNCGWTRCAPLQPISSSKGCGNGAGTLSSCISTTAKNSFEEPIGDQTVICFLASMYLASLLQLKFRAP